MNVGDKAYAKFMLEVVAKQLGCTPAEALRRFKEAAKERERERPKKNGGKK